MEANYLRAAATWYIEFLSVRECSSRREIPLNVKGLSVGTHFCQ